MRIATAPYLTDLLTRLVASLSVVNRSRAPPKYFAKASPKTGGAFETDENNVMHE
jgi:hypothetical protein